MRDLLEVLALHGPQDPNQRVVLMILAADSNSRRQVAMTNVRIASATGFHEKVVAKAIERLIEHSWLSPLPSGGFEIRSSPARARVGTRARSLALTPTVDTSESGLEPKTRDSKVYSNSGARGPQGTGSREGLGVSNCPHCGGTGWMEVDPVANGHGSGNHTVDICTCRGGPVPKARSVYPPSKPLTAGLTPQQMMTNLQGVAAARKEGRDEEEA